MRVSPEAGAAPLRDIEVPEDSEVVPLTSFLGKVARFSWPLLDTLLHQLYTSLTPALTVSHTSPTLALTSQPWKSSPSAAATPSGQQP